MFFSMSFIGLSIGMALGSVLVLRRILLGPRQHTEKEQLDPEGFMPMSLSYRFLSNGMSKKLHIALISISYVCPAAFVSFYFGLRLDTSTYSVILNLFCLLRNSSSLLS